MAKPEQSIEHVQSLIVSGSFPSADELVGPQKVHERVIRFLIDQPDQRLEHPNAGSVMMDVVEMSPGQWERARSRLGVQLGIIAVDKASPESRKINQVALRPPKILEHINEPFVTRELLGDLASVIRDPHALSSSIAVHGSIQHGQEKNDKPKRIIKSDTLSFSFAAGENYFQRIYHKPDFSKLSNDQRALLAVGFSASVNMDKERQISHALRIMNKFRSVDERINETTVFQVIESLMERNVLSEKGTSLHLTDEAYSILAPKQRWDKQQPRDNQLSLASQEILDMRLTALELARELGDWKVVDSLGEEDITAFSELSIQKRGPGIRKLLEQLREDYAGVFGSGLGDIHAEHSTDTVSDGHGDDAADEYTHSSSAGTCVA